MNYRKYDVVKIVDKDHWDYGKDIYVITHEGNVLGCKVDRNYTTYVQLDQIEFIKRPRRNEVPEYVLNF
jgi:hypothetical protein